MRRRLAYGAAVLLTLLCLLAALGGAAWLFGTAEGARWVLAALSRYTPLMITARQVEGRLGDRLRLAGVSLALPPYAVEVDSLELHWRPLLLVTGRAAISGLTLTGVAIQDDDPAQVPDLTWPRISALAGISDLRIDALEVRGVTYRRLAGEPLPIGRLSARLAWRGGLLTIENLIAEAVAGRLTGRAAVGLERPSLELALTASPAAPLAGLDAFVLAGRFAPGQGGEQVAGAFALTGTAAGRERLALAGEAGMTRKTIRLSKLRLTAAARRGTLSGGGEITPTAAGVRLALKLAAAGLDLAPELGMPTDLGGTVTLTGTAAAYRGEFALTNRGRGWRGATLSGALAGDAAGVRLAPLSGSLLAGTLAGELDIRWADGIVLSGALRGRGLDPGRLAPDWQGVVNADLAGRVAWPAGGARQAELRGRLLESRLHGRALTGELEAEAAGDELRIGRLLLKGKGFDLQAAGDLARRLNVAIQVADLSLLVPQTAGSLRAEGWARWREGRPSGVLHGRGRSLAGFGLRIGDAAFDARLGEEKEQALALEATLSKVGYGALAADSLRLSAAGTAQRHTLRLALRAREGEVQVGLTGAYARKAWQGTIASGEGRDSVGPWRLTAPAALAVTAERIILAPLVLAGRGAERLEVAADLAREPLAGSARAAWRAVELDRARVWLPGALRIEGRLTGEARATLAAGERLAVAGEASLAGGKVRWQAGREALTAALATAQVSWDWQGPLGADPRQVAAGRLVAAGRIAAAGEVTLDGHAIAVPRLALSLDGGDRGWRGALEVEPAGGGTLRGSFVSADPARLATPEQGEVTATAVGLDLALLRPWLPAAIGLEGRLSGRAAGNLLPGGRFALQGDASLSGGRARWRSPEGEIGAELRATSLAWSWRDESLTGEMTLALAEHGRLGGQFRLPVPARLPFAVQAGGPLQGSLTGQVREAGLLTALFPGMLQESRGVIDTDLRLSGTWEDPQFGGQLRLGAAGAYLPAAGVRLRDLQLTLNLEKDLIRVADFRVASGPGHLTGEASIRLAGWRVAGYEGRLAGERFQAVFLPELQVLATPQLTFSGTPEKLTVRGEVNLPEVLIAGAPVTSVVEASSDVIVEGARQRAARAFPLPLDVQVRITLGERVLVKVGGIDAQLAGAVELQFQNPERITSRGEIRVVRGNYKTYGVDLTITRGRLFYAGVPLNQPTLDILALRTVGGVKAGVLIGGSIAAPTVRLYGEPAMPDVDILSYIVFGRPLAGGDQAGLMVQAAGMLLSRGQSVVLQEQIKSRLGLSTLELQTGSGEPAGSVGYRGTPVTPSTPADVAPGRTAASLTETVLTVGKYLTPQLYFSYGRSLFSGDNLFRLRYDLTPRWQIETQTGSASGVDLYYKIEFR